MTIDTIDNNNIGAKTDSGRTRPASNGMEPQNQTPASEIKKEEVKVEILVNPKISIDDVLKVEIRVGKILSAEKIEKSEKLLKLSVDFGEATPRQILSGIAKYFTDPAELVGKHLLFYANLAPREMMGLESNGMILAVSTSDTFCLPEVPTTIPPGTRAK